MQSQHESTGILLFAHGSVVEEANRSVHELARQVQALGRHAYVRAAFLDVAQPSLEEAIAEAVGAGMRRVIVLPFFLTMGIHLRRDLPARIAPLEQKHPELDIEVGESLEGHPLMAEIILSRIQSVLQASKVHEG
jgi:sirohydrochlorin ferrochelatase